MALAASASQNLPGPFEVVLLDFCCCPRYATFVVAFLSSIWSCLIYTALVPVKEEEALLDAELAEFQSTEDTQTQLPI